MGASHHVSKVGLVRAHWTRTPSRFKHIYTDIYIKKGSIASISSLACAAESYVGASAACTGARRGTIVRAHVWESRRFGKRSSEGHHHWARRLKTCAWQATQTHPSCYQFSLAVAFLLFFLVLLCIDVFAAFRNVEVIVNFRGDGELLCLYPASWNVEMFSFVCLAASWRAGSFFVFVINSGVRVFFCLPMSVCHWYPSKVWRRMANAGGSRKCKLNEINIDC